jgi:hypothetical protein
MGAFNRAAVPLAAVAVVLVAAAFVYAGSRPRAEPRLSSARAEVALRIATGSEIHQARKPDGMYLWPSDPARPGSLGWFWVVVYPTAISSASDRRVHWISSICGLAFGGRCWVASANVASNARLFQPTARKQITNAQRQAKTAIAQALAS